MAVTPRNTGIKATSVKKLCFKFEGDITKKEFLQGFYSD